MLETDHLVTRRTRAKAREPLLVTLADLLLRYRRGHNPRRGVPFRVLRPGSGRRARLLSLAALNSFTIAALSLRKNAFPQSDDLWAQSLAAKLALETDHLVTRLTGAKACEPLFVTLARLLLGHRRRLFRRRRYRRRKRHLLFLPLGLCLRPLVFIPAPLGGLAGDRFPFEHLQAISSVRRPGGGGESIDEIAERR